MLLRWRMRTVVFYFVLLLGNFSGVPMLAKDIDEALHAHKQAVVEASTPDSEEDDGDGEIKSVAAIEGAQQ